MSVKRCRTGEVAKIGGASGEASGEETMPGGFTTGDFIPALAARQLLRDRSRNAQRVRENQACLNPSCEIARFAPVRRSVLARVTRF